MKIVEMQDANAFQISVSIFDSVNLFHKFPQNVIVIHPEQQLKLCKVISPA